MSNCDSRVAVDKETVKGMLLQLGGIDVSDEELDRVLPAVQAYVDSIARLDEGLDLRKATPGWVFRVNPEE